MDALEAYSIKAASDIVVFGNDVLYTQKYIKNGEYKSCIFKISANANPEQITFGECEKLPRIINGSLYYVRYGKGKETLISLDYGKEPREIASFSKITDYIALNSNLFVIALEASDESSPFCVKNLKYKFNGRGLLRNYYGLYQINGSPRKIYGGQFDVLHIKNNGKRIIIETSEFCNDYSLSDLCEITTEGKFIKRITKESAKINDFAISSQGRIAFSGHYGKRPWEISRIIFPEEDNKSIILGADSSNTVISDSFVSPKYSLKFDGGTLYAIGQERSSSFIYKIENEVKKLTEDRQNIIDFDFSGELAFIYSTQEHPSIIHFHKDYDINPNIVGKKSIPIEFEGGEGFVMFRSKDSPSLVFIHGGPHVSYGHSYFIEFQYMFDNGYNIIFTNPPGSTGYGDRYAEALVGDRAQSTYGFVRRFISLVKEKYGINNKIGLTGGSFGGYMTNWIITQTNDFACAISERSNSNLLTMVGTSDIGFWFTPMENNIENPYSQEGMKKLMELSPITYSQKVRTPIMLITGEEDYRCPIEQAEQFYIALKLNNVETELIRYPGDNHEHARNGVPKNMIDRLERKLNWFDKFLKA